jgi:hypothetical protein
LLSWGSKKYYIIWVCVCSFYLFSIQCTCALLYCHPWPVRLYNNFPHSLINCTIFWIKLQNVKCVFLFSLQLLCETVLIPRRTERHTIQSVYWSSCKVLLFCSAVMKLEFSWQIFENYSHKISLKSFQWERSCP